MVSAFFTFRMIYCTMLYLVRNVGATWKFHVATQLKMLTKQHTIKEHCCFGLSTDSLSNTE